MRTIHKFPFETTEAFTVEMPKHTEILSVQVQLGQPCMWCLVDPSAKKVSKKFRVYGTDHPINNDHDQLKFIGTYQTQGGVNIWHLFEVQFESNN